MRLVLLNPAALALLVIAAVPVLVHLLVRRPARRMPFPTLRFIAAGRTRAARLRAVEDWPLLLVRTLVVLGAVVALARPLLVTPARAGGWERRVARLIVVDTSGSAAPALASAREVASREARGAYASRMIETAVVARALRQAEPILAAFPPARREVVVVSDFQEGTIGPGVLGAIPPHVGVRLVKLPGPRQADAPARPGVPRVLVAPADADAARRAVEAVARANEVAVDAVDRRAIVAVDGAPGLDALTARASAVSAPWMADVVHAIESSAALPADARSIRASAVDGRLLIVTRTSPRTFAFAVLIDHVQRGLYAGHAAREAWLGGESPAQLAALERTAGGVPPDAIRQSTTDDARWFWTAVAGLLGAETWLRSRARRRQKTGAAEVRAA